MKCGEGVLKHSAVSRGLDCKITFQSWISNCLNKIRYKIKSPARTINLCKNFLFVQLLTLLTKKALCKSPQSSNWRHILEITYWFAKICGYYVEYNKILTLNGDPWWHDGKDEENNLVLIHPITRDVCVGGKFCCSTPFWPRFITSLVEPGCTRLIPVVFAACPTSEPFSE